MLENEKDQHSYTDPRFIYRLNFYKDGTASPRSEANKVTLEIGIPFPTAMDFSWPEQTGMLERIEQGLEKAYERGQWEAMSALRKLIGCAKA